MAALVLASASPRRREILETLGIAFEVVPSEVAEVRAAGESAGRYVRRLAADKAKDVAARMRDRAPAPFVLGADTTVVLGAEVLEKPADDADARRMIRALAGRAHRVITAVALARAGGGVLEVIAASTEVRFRPLDEKEVAAYVATGEGRDKAGAYAVQGVGAGLVESVSGSYSNVVGLPAAETVLLLRRHGAIASWP
jgi:septum formation protein